MKRSSPGAIPRASALLAATMPFIAGGHAALLSFGEPLLVRALVDRSFAVATLGVGAVTLALQVLLAPWALLQNLRRPPRSAGRARLLVLAAGSLLHGLSTLALAALYADAETARLLESGLGLHAPSGRKGAVAAALTATAFGGTIVAGASITCWFLLPKTLRARFFLVFDLVVLVAAGWAIATLPARPENPLPAALMPAVLRHAITTIAALRFAVRVTPTLLNVIEAIGFRSLVAARHLRAKKSGFLAAISLLSVLAVTVSCTALTATLSVMGGFRNDLKRKILGNNAHIVIDRERGSIEGWEPLLAAARDVNGVTGVAPYVSGEVMLSSASNLATAVLRGIDPDTIGEVNDLPNNLTNGKLEYLVDPEKLRDLPVELMRSPTFPFDDPGLRRAPDDESDAASLEDHDPDQDAGVAPQGSADSAGSTTTPDSAKARAERKLAELEAFLKDPTPAQDRAREPRELLPGIIIGQELARALRLFVGDEVNVVAPLGALGPSGPMPKARPFRVAGIFYSGMYEYDMKFTYVALPRAQTFLGSGDAISGIEVRVSDIERAPAAADAIRTALGRPELRVRDWQDLNKQLFGALALEKLAMFIALGIAILVASFCIAGTLTLMVQEKGREVAILKAMGTSDRTVVGVFVIEGGLIGLLGAALGLFLGYMACFAAEHFGIRMNPEVYYIDRLPVHVDPTEFLLTGVAAVAVCLLVTIYPALLASRLRPVDALRYE